MSGNTASAKATQEETVVEKKSGNGAKKQKPAVDPSFNMDELRELADLVIEHGFTDFEFENENIRVRLSKMTGVTLGQAPVASAPLSAPAATNTPEPTAIETADPDAGLHKITSPIVGTFYRSPGPDKDVYVSEGSSISPESTVCIVEAMKLMNEIEAEQSGTVIEVFAQNGKSVEFGQKLFRIKKA